MRKSHAIILILIAIIIAMTIPYLNNEMSQEERWLLSDADISFRLEFHVLVFQFGDILTYASQAKSSEDLAYVKGRIESMLQTHNSQIARLNSQQNISQELKDEVIDPSIQKPLFKLIGSMKSMLSDLNEKIIKKEDFEKLDKIRAQLSSIYLLSRDFNNGSSNRFRGKEEIDQQKELIEKMQIMINGISI